ncbi:MAG: hypothetical protein GY772_21080 [bacterium]|nr:hypothetical protein [bacterium]
MREQAEERGRGGGRGPAVDESLIEIMLKEGGFMWDRAFVIVQDARMMSDIEASSSREGKSSRFRNGTYPANMETVVQHEAFRSEFLPAVLRQMRWALHQVDEVHIAIYCNKGRHRSVACATLLCHLIQAAGSSAVQTVEHLTRNHWSRFCDDCTLCRRPSDVRDRVLFEARGIARDLVEPR